MTNLSLEADLALSLRYDGPIPRQHFETARAARRRDRGTIAVLERQAAHLMDTAARCDDEAEELAADLMDGRATVASVDVGKQRLNALTSRLDGYVSRAAEILQKSAALRRQIGLPSHPLVKLAAIIASSSAPRAERLSLLSNDISIS